MITNRMIRKGMKISSLAPIPWTFAFSIVQGPVLAGALLVMEMSNFQIGLVNSFLVLFLPFQLIGAIIQKKYFKRKIFWGVTTTLHWLLIGTLALLFALWDNFDVSTIGLLFTFIYGTGFLFAQMGASSWFSWMGELVPPKEAAKYWNMREVIVKASSLVAFISVGVLIDYLGKDEVSTYLTMFAIASITGLIHVIMQLIPVDPDRYANAEVKIPFLERLKKVWAEPNFRSLTIAVSFYSFIMWLPIPFYFIYMQQNLGLSMTFIQCLIGLQLLISVFSGYCFTVLGKKYGMKPILMLCGVVKLLEFIGWGFAIPEWGWLPLLPPLLLGGFCNMGYQTAQMAMITTIGDRENQSFMVSVYFGIVGIISFIGGTASGLVMDFITPLVENNQFGLSALNTMHFVLAGSFILFLYLLRTYNEEGGTATGKVVKILVSRNPLRGIYQAHVLSRPQKEHSRLQILSKSHGDLVAGELLADLYNPSTRVRETAIWSISQSKTKINPVVIDELIKIMDCPELMIQAPAARALGYAKAKDAVDILTKYTVGNDCTLAQSCIYALGLIGDTRALNSLCDLLLHERYRPLWPLACEAIGKMGTHRNARLIYEAYRHESNWIMKKQILIALVNCMTKKGAFFESLEKEEKESGSDIEGKVKVIETLLKSKFDTRWPVLKDMLAGTMNEFDSEDYKRSAEQLIATLFFGYNLVPGFKQNSNTNEVLKDMFCNSSNVQYPPFTKNTLRAVACWLLVNLWGEFTDGEEKEFNRYIHLSILWLVTSFLQNQEIKTTTE